MRWYLKNGWDLEPRNWQAFKADKGLEVADYGVCVKRTVSSLVWFDHHINEGEEWETMA